MGRELKRVPLDFKWPIGRIWHGYINPFYGKHSSECIHCEGTGESPEVRKMVARWYGYGPFHPSETGSAPFTPDHPDVRKLAEWNVRSYGKDEAAIQREAQRLCALFNGQWAHHLSQEDVQACWDNNGLMHWSHCFNKETNRWERKKDAKVPTAKEVNDWSILASLEAPSSHRVIPAAAKRMKVRTKCQHCKGEGVLWDDPKSQWLANRWSKMHPPKGEGYQLWGTTNEGEPMSPVFPTLDALCEWLEPNATTFGSHQTSKENWKQMLDEGMVVHKEGNLIFI